MTDSALKGSGKRESLSQVEIRVKATMKGLGGWVVGLKQKEQVKGKAVDYMECN